MDLARVVRVLLFGLAAWGSGWRRWFVAAALVWLPAGLVLAGAGLSALTGCPASEVGARPCLVAGLDIGGFLYTSVTMAWVVIVLLPFMLVTLLMALGAGAIALVRAWRRPNPR